MVVVGECLIVVGVGDGAANGDESSVMTSCPSFQFYMSVCKTREIINTRKIERYLKGNYVLNYVLIPYHCCWESKINYVKQTIDSRILVYKLMMSPHETGTETFE